MTVSLWVLWAVVVALAVPALLGSVPGEEGRRRRLVRLWAPAAVALVVTVVASIDAAKVSEDELYDATDRAAQTLSGTLSGGAVPDRVAAAVEDRLGHPVSVSGPVSGPWSSEATDEEQEERYVVEDTDERGVGGDGTGPAVCVVARVFTVRGGDGVATGLTWTWLEVDRGRCEDEG